MKLGNFIAIVCAVLLITVSLTAARKITKPAFVFARLDGAPKIIIDAGHGGVDGGAVGVDGESEKGLNLAISLRLRDLFVSGGYEVVMTREEDVSIHDAGAQTIRQKKVSDLNNRLRIAKDNPNAIFLSIHQNKFGDSSVKGSQMYYGKNDDGSSVLAEILRSRFNDMIHPGGSRAVKAADKNLFLLYNSPLPTVLVECGFLSNHEESALLRTEEYQDKLAFVIFVSVLEYVAGENM